MSGIPSLAEQQEPLSRQQPRGALEPGRHRVDRKRDDRGEYEDRDRPWNLSNNKDDRRDDDDRDERDPQPVNEPCAHSGLHIKRRSVLKPARS